MENEEEKDYDLLKDENSVWLVSKKLDKHLKRIIKEESQVDWDAFDWEAFASEIDQLGALLETPLVESSEESIKENEKALDDRVRKIMSAFFPRNDGLDYGVSNREIVLNFLEKHPPKVNKEAEEEKAKIDAEKAARPVIISERPPTRFRKKHYYPIEDSRFPTETTSELAMLAALLARVENSPLVVNKEAEEENKQLSRERNKDFRPRPLNPRHFR